MKRLSVLISNDITSTNWRHYPLWIVNYRESQPPTKKYISLGLKKAAAERKSIKNKNIYISDYEKFLSYYKNTDIGPDITAAKNNAWDKTLAYFNEHSIYKTGLEKVAVPPATTEKLLARLEEVMSAYPPSKKDWRQEKKELEILLQEKSQSNNISKKDAAKDFIYLLQTDPQYEGTHFISTALPAFVSIFIKESEESLLWQELQNHTEFKDFKKDNLWRLVTTYQEQNNHSKYNDENEMFYTNSMYSAFRRMLKHRHKMFTASHLLELHDIFVKEHIVTIPFSTDSKVIGIIENSKENIKKLGYKKEAHQYELIIKTPTNSLSYNATLHGVKELIEKSLAENNRHFEIKDYRFDINGNLIADTNGKVATLVVPTRKTKDAQTYAETTIISYHIELARATTAEQKMIAIARVCRDLASFHLFEQDSARVISIIIMNKLLLQNNFSPVVLESDQHLEGFSVTELTDTIKLGQTIFATTSQYKETSTNKQRHTSIEDDPRTLKQDPNEIDIEPKTETEVETAIEAEYVSAYQQRYSAL